ncbi:MAG: hypothetical protein ACYC1I_12225 [Acidimicrobiales bacterium]
MDKFGGRCLASHIFHDDEWLQLRLRDPERDYINHDIYDTADINHDVKYTGIELDSTGRHGRASGIQSQHRESPMVCPRSTWNQRCNPLHVQGLVVLEW